MQEQNYSNLFQQDSGFSFETNESSILQDSDQQNFLKGLKNAHSLLSGLERSIKKTDDYERRLLRCKKSHPHSHEPIPGKARVKKEKKEPPLTQMNPNESWSTMSLVCLQYQYDELVKRYNTLLKDHDDLCSTLQRRNTQLSQLEARAKMAKNELTRAHEVILIVGEKCLAATRRMQNRKKLYQAKVEQLREVLDDMLLAAERAREDLDSLCSLWYESNHN